MVFRLMNRDIHAMVPGVKNVAETEEIVACAICRQSRRSTWRSCESLT